MINHLNQMRIKVTSDKKGERYISLEGDHGELGLTESSDLMSALQLAAANLRLMAAKLDNMSLMANFYSHTEDSEHDMFTGFYAS